LRQIGVNILWREVRKKKILKEIAPLPPNPNFDRLFELGYGSPPERKVKRVIAK
jgi:hypothetical protein